MQWKWLIRTTWNHLRGKNAVGRGVDVLPDDIFLVSYPRSGNTWTRFLIGNLVHHDDAVTFTNLERKVPDIYINSRVRLQRMNRPRILKSHEPFDPRYKRVIYIVRDPRDVAISSYHFHIKYRLIEEGYPVEKYVSEWVAGMWWPHGSWGQHTLTWLLTRRKSVGFLMLRYEDILADPFEQLRRSAEFLGLPTDGKRIARAVELSSAARMRVLERKQSRLWRGTKRSRQDKPFVRSGKSGGWRSELPPVSVAEIEAAWGPVLHLLGYPLTVDTAVSSYPDFDLDSISLPAVASVSV
jgi:sulfotransferase family protein